MALYDRIGVDYARHRQPEPAWERAIQAALGEAGPVINVGAGAGSYEPRQRRVVAVEPSRTMIAQRGHGSPPVVQGVAGALPFRDRTFDAAMAILTVHHWPDAAAGLAELRRVARRQLVVSWDPGFFRDAFWRTRDYLPGFAEHEHHLAAAPFIARHLDNVRVIPLPVPHDCRDGMFGAYWRRPEAYLDPSVRASISAFATMPPGMLDPALARLGTDLATGAWHQRYADLLDLDALDLGYCILAATNA